MDNHERLNMIHYQLVAGDDVTHLQQPGTSLLAYMPDKRFIEFVQSLFPSGSIRPEGLDSSSRNSKVFGLGGPWHNLVNVFMLHGSDIIRPINHIDFGTVYKQYPNIIVKIQLFWSNNQNGDVDGKKKDACILEDTCHRLLSLIPEHICPRFFCGLSVPIPHPDSVGKNLNPKSIEPSILSARLSFMEHLDGAKVLSHFMDPNGHFVKSELNNDTLKHYNIIECIFQRLTTNLEIMWKAGIVHCDLHEHNILVNPLGDEVYILDFGHAIKLPDQLKSILVAHLSAKPQSSHIDEVFLKCKDVTSFIVNTQMSRGFTYFYPDWAFLSMFRAHLNLLRMRNIQSKSSGHGSKKSHDKRQQVRYAPSTNAAL